MTRSLGSDDGISGVHVSPTVPVEFLLEVHRPQGGAGHIAYHFELTVSSISTIPERQDSKLTISSADYPTGIEQKFGCTAQEWCFHDWVDRYAKDSECYVKDERLPYSLSGATVIPTIFASFISIAILSSNILLTLPAVWWCFRHPVGPCAHHPDLPYRHMTMLRAPRVERHLDERVPENGQHHGSDGRPRSCESGILWLLPHKCLLTSSQT